MLVDSSAGIFGELPTKVVLRGCFTQFINNYYREKQQLSRVG
jgi:hypothetical protein